jgi:hypothetical protein
MSMLKSSVAKAVAAAVAMAAGSTAFAAISPTDAPSDLFIAVWNPTTNTSFVGDLGSSFSFSALDSGSFNTAGFSTSIAVDGGNLNSVLGGGTYSYSLFAGNTTPHQNVFATYLGDTAFLSQNFGSALFPLSNAGAFTSAMGTLDNYIDNNFGCPGGPGVGSCTAPGASSFTAVDTGTAASKYWASSAVPGSPGHPGADFQLATYPGHATVGDAGLELTKYFAPADGGDNGSDPTVASFVGANGLAGVFSLDSSGTLSYSAGAVTGVPLPAAGWLLMSGLLGLGAVGRRKAKAVAA